MQAINYLLNIAFEAMVILFILRIWLQTVKADFYNPMSQFIVKVTNPMVLPLRRFIPSIGRIDTTTLLLAFAFSTLKFIVIPLINSGLFEPLMASYLGLISMLKQGGVLLFMLMLAMAVMSWVVQGYNPTLAIFHQLTEPFLKPIRNIVPSIGGLDLSVLIAFVLLNVINFLLSDFIPYWPAI